jgi:hypothetical protein
MGFKKNWDVIDIVTQLNIMAMECRSPLNDGYTAWEVKQDLLRIKWLLEDALNRCPSFSGEEEFVRKHEHDVLIKILKGN